MKSKSVTFIFILVAIVLAGVFYLSEKMIVGHKNSSDVTRAKVISPKSSREKEEEKDNLLSVQDSEVFESLIRLNSTETLISSMVVDLDKDTNDDEVVVVRRSGSQYLWLIPGIFNKDTKFYDRMEAIPTKILSTRTFSYSTMDMLGDHSVALIYEGVEESGNYVMKIFHCETVNGRNRFVTIGDFSSDGTIFIQQTERSDAYALSMTKSEPYSVWVYKSDSEGDDNSDALNQIRQEFKWNPKSNKYELASETKVAASRLAASELSRIQDGTVETFASFLDGLWYKTDNSDPEIRYLYFDYKSKEIILLFGDTQEVYIWEDGKLRHNGIYITTINSDIVNLYRRFDIALSNVDEIKITIRDQVSLDIKEKTLWDGQYKKMSIQSDFSTNSVNDELKTLMAELKKDKNWTSSELQMTLNFTDYNYFIYLKNADENAYEESGIYSVSKKGNFNVFQFRSDIDSMFFNVPYAVSFGTKTIVETVKKKTVEKVVTDYNTIIFTPVRVTPTDCYITEGRSFTFICGEDNL